ncbi:MAG TPA: hypothetical protein VMG59_07160 [Phycisphaerae bacterium]|nr:hypothetical protein [Phycisphaerae bacterium]
MKKNEDSYDFSQRLWDSGQRLLIAGQYMAARRELEAAEQQAWRRRDAVLLSRIYLPLLEACRQIRQQASGALIVIAELDQPSKRFIQPLLDAGQGTLICSGRTAMQVCSRLMLIARQNGLSIETLLLGQTSAETRIYSLGAPHYAAGLPVLWSRDFSHLIEPASPEKLIVPLPWLGSYQPGNPAHTVARESLLLAWEALALKEIPEKIESLGLWQQMDVLRSIRPIDPACEPVVLRLIALAEQISRRVESC